MGLLRFLLRRPIEAPDPAPHTGELTEPELDTLAALVERGPLWDGHIPSRLARDALVLRQMAARIVCGGADGFTAATYRGRD